MKLKRIVITGGGTGGHIFPAIAVANAIKRIDPSVSVLFIGAKGKMEMEKVPQAGYEIKGLDIAGFNRSNLLKNWSLPFKLVKSFIQVRKIFREFNPDAVFGVGGYSTFPVMSYAQRKGIATFIHESNSFAGKSNMLLGKKADLIMVATSGMEKFFPKGKLVITGNPVRTEISNPKILREDALDFFGMKEGKPIVLVVGGSLGSRSINRAIASGIDAISKAGLQLIWQTGKGNLDIVSESLRKRKEFCVTEFIGRMHYAFAIADVVVSRAGAITLAEICAMSKASILVPYPFATEDHQTYNASVLEKHGASIIVSDNSVENKLVDTIISLAADKEKCISFGNAANELFVKDADKKIAQLIFEKMNEKK